MSRLFVTYNKWCVGKLLSRKRGKKALIFIFFLVFDNYPGVNTPIVVDFKLPRFNKQLVNFRYSNNWLL